VYENAESQMNLRRAVVISKQSEIRQLAQKISQQVLVADDVIEAVDIVATVTPDLILLDSLQQPGDIHTILNASHNNFRTVIVIVGNNGTPPAWLAQFAQVCNIEYLAGPGDYEQLQRILGKIQSQTKTGKTNDLTSFFADDLAASVSMAGKSKAILHTLKMIKLVAGSNCNPVLIIGETGTGKELVAKAVHVSRHPNEPFVAINCAALTANLLESELFGHIKGSFTSADRDKTGLLELAGQGTIFLDEISEMPLDLQAKLLRVLQEKTFRKVGGISDLTTHATIIATSNRDLRQEVQANRFRRDLYYRLNICPIALAPLRTDERRMDIRPLAEYFLKTSTVCPDKTGRITSLTEMAVEAIEKHTWPGNVRELRNVIDRAIMLETTDKIGLSSIFIESDIGLVHQTDSTTSASMWPTFSKLGAMGSRQDIKSGEDCPSTLLGAVSLSNRQIEPSAFGGRTSPVVDNLSGPLKTGDFSLDKAERELIARALQESGWQKTRAAALLGITRATLYAKVKQHNIQRGTYIPKLACDNLQEEARSAGHLTADDSSLIADSEPVTIS
jgi:DNA-binding NtrC family response regulator